MNARERVAEKTGTKPFDWEYINGPDTGVGIEFWLRNMQTNQEAYYCDDQGCISITITPSNWECNDSDCEECSDCGEKMQMVMQDLDGTNLEEGLECKNPDCPGRE